MTKTLKAIIGMFALILGVFFTSNSIVVNAETIITSDMRQQFSDKSNMLAFAVDFNESENKYRLKHNNGSNGWYSTHDTLQELLDSLNASASSYLSGNTWDIHIEFTEMVPLNETITFKKRVEWQSYKYVNFYITSSNDGTIFDVTRTSGQYKDMYSSYDMIETSSASIVVDGNNSFLSVYFYDCTINGLVSLESKNNADIYLDNANIYLLGYTMYIENGSAISARNNDIILGDKYSTSDDFKVLNDSTLGIYKLKACNGSTCKTFNAQAYVYNYANMVLSDTDELTHEVIDFDNTFFLNYSNLTIDGNLYWVVYDEEYIRISNNDGKISFNNEIKIYKENRLLDNFVISISTDCNDSIRAYNFTSNYEYKIYHDSYMDGSIYVRGDAASIDNFTGYGTALNERAHPTDENAPFIAQTIVSDDIETGDKVLGLKFNYFWWVLYSNYTNYTYTGYVEKGKSIDESVYISASILTDTVFYDFTGHEYYELKGYYVDNKQVEIPSFSEWVPNRYNDSLMYMLSARKYYFEFDEESLYGAVPYESSVNYDYVGQTYNFSTTFKDYTNFDENARVLIGWSFTKEGEIITSFNPSPETFANVTWNGDKPLIGITLYARYRLKYAVTYTAPEAPNYKENIIRYIEEGKKASDFSNYLPSREDADFLYWYDITNPNEPFDFNTPITKTITLRAKWYEKYTITLYSPIDVIWTKNGEEFTPVENKYSYTYYEDEIGINADNIILSRPDYIFQYWYYISDDHEFIWDFTSVLEADLTIYPKWKIEQYTVYFSKGVIDAEDIDKFVNFPESRVVDKYSYISEPIFIENVEDWDFKHWRESGAHEYEAFNFENVQITKDIYLVIQWTYVDYDIEWVIKSPLDNSDIEMTSECQSKWSAFSTTYIGTTLKLPNDCIVEESYPEGYVFAGWSLTSGVEANEVITTIYADKKTHNYRNFKFYAVWAKLYDVKFTTGELTQEMNSWWWCNPNDECDTLWEGAENEYQILKVAKYGYASDIYDFYYRGHYLTHWYLDGDLEKEPFDFENTQITEDIVLHPQFGLKDVNLTFIQEDEKAQANAGIWPSDQTIKFGETFECPDVVLTYPGYEFMYWATKYTSGFDVVYTRYDWQEPWKYERTLQLYPVWETVKYSWEYVLTTPDGNNDVTLTGNYVSEVNVEMKGNVKALPTVSNLSGVPSKYIFIGWVNENDSSGEVITSVEVNEDTLKDMVFYAQYEFRTLKVKYTMRAQVETERYCLEIKDSFGVYHVGDINHYQLGLPCDYIEYLFDSEEDYLTIVNPKNMYVIDADYYVSDWKVGLNILEEGTQFTYEEALEYRDNDDEVSIRPVLTPYSFKPEIKLYDDEVSASERVNFYIQNKTGQTREYLFVFRVSNNKYNLVGKTTTDSQGYIDLYIPGIEFGIGENNVVAIYVYDQELDLEECINYESLSNVYKIKYEFEFTLTPGIIDESIIEMPWFTYDGSEHVVDSSNTILPDGVTIISNTQVDAGTYYATVSIENTNHYKWSDNTTDDKTFAWVINRRCIYPKQEGGLIAEFDYDGQVKEITIDMLFNEELPIDEYILSDTYKTSEGGEHRLELILTKNYTFYDGFTRDFYWIINPKIIGVPRIKGEQTSLKTHNYITMNYEINKEEFTLYDFIDAEYLDNLDEGIIELVGDTTYRGVRSYNFSITIAQPLNYSWSNFYDFPAPGFTPSVSGSMEAIIDVQVVKASVKYPVLVDKDDFEINMGNAYNGVINGGINYDGLEHSYTPKETSAYYRVEGSIQNVKNVGEYTISFIPVEAENMCWIREYEDNCWTADQVTRTLTFKFNIDPSYKDGHIYIHIDNGHFWYELFGFEESEVASILFMNSQHLTSTGFPKSYFDVDTGYNNIDYWITWIDPNYTETPGAFSFEWEGDPFTFNESIFDCLTPPSQDDENNDNNSNDNENNNNDESNNNQNSQDTNTSSSKGQSTGCSRGGSSKAYGDLFTLLSVLGIVFIKKKKLF